jgi:hypothetical protein
MEALGDGHSDASIAKGERLYVRLAHKVMVAWVYLMGRSPPRSVRHADAGIRYRKLDPVAAVRHLARGKTCKFIGCESA